MTFGKKTLFSSLLGLDLLTNVLEFAHVNFLSTTTLISFCTYIILPGFLISLILRIKKISFWENLLIIVGLSIAFLEFGGLSLNILLPLIGIEDPLSSQNIIFGFDIYVLLLFLFAWIRTKSLPIQLPEQRAFENVDTVISIPIAGQSYPVVETGLTTHARPSQFLKPGFIRTLEQSRLDVGSSSVAHIRPSQFLKPGFIDAHQKTLENVDTTTSTPIALPKRSNIEKVLYILPVFFPILSILGAIILNNGGSNALTLILLGSIVFYSLLLVIFHKKISVDLYPYAIFFIGLPSLFTTSLRSWYITGHDIETEFYVFKLTDTHHFWNMAFFQDPYNACLSITILPTILTNLLSVQDMYIYKVIFQILFATVPVLVFFILKPYTTPIVAFLSAFLFMSFPTFFTDMAMLNRQEIGFIFFGLVLYIMLDREQNQQSDSKIAAPPLSALSLSTRRILFIIFALSVIISHYSTNFVLIALVGFVYVSTIIISLPFVKKPIALLVSKSRIKPKNAFPNKAFLSLPLILILFGSTYLWNNLYTHSSSNATSVIAEVIINTIFVTSNVNQSSDLSVSIFNTAPKKNPEQELQDYIKKVVKQAKSNVSSKNGSDSLFYSTSITSKYPSYPVPQNQLPPTPLGNLLSSLHIPVFNINAGLRLIAAYFIQIFVIVGLLAIFFFRNKKTFDLQFVSFCFGALFLLALMTVLPSLSAEYGVLRMFQQFLFVLSLPIVLGINLIFFFIKEQKRMFFTGIIIFILFLDLTGFISHLTGDYYPQMTMDNVGLYYDTYYVHKSDVLAIVWLSKNKTENNPVQTDVSGRIKLRAYGEIVALNEDFPLIIQKNAYVYQKASVNAVVSINGNLFIYSSTKPFLDDNKDLIYSNGNNNIYK